MCECVCSLFTPARISFFIFLFLKKHLLELLPPISLSAGLLNHINAICILICIFPSELLSSLIFFFKMLCHICFYFYFFKVFLLIMLLQFSQVSPLYLPSNPPAFPRLSPCPWVVHISSLSPLFPIPFFIFPHLFYAY